MVTYDKIKLPSKIRTSARAERVGDENGEHRLDDHADSCRENQPEMVWASAELIHRQIYHRVKVADSLLHKDALMVREMHLNEGPAVHFSGPSETALDGHEVARKSKPDVFLCVETPKIGVGV